MKTQGLAWQPYLMRCRRASAAVVLGLLAACGGSNPLDNPNTIANPAGVSGQKLSFIYYQKCINPIFLARLQSTLNGVQTTNTCATGGCHDNTNGTGGAFRVDAAATAVDLSNPANTPDVVRTTAMYKNFFSAQGEVVFGNALQSRLLTKPLVLNVLHGGGLIFANEQDANVKLLKYWIEHPMPQGQDEFSTAANNLFEPADAATGACKTE